MPGVDRVPNEHVRVPRRSPSVVNGGGVGGARVVVGGRPDRPLTGSGLLALQRLAGNAAAGALVSRQTATPTAPQGAAPTPTATPAAATRPHLRRGDVDQQVGVAQEMLNACGTAPDLAVDGEFGAQTEAAVRRFQRGRGRPRSGTLDAGTWTDLEACAPGGVVAADGSLTAVTGPGPADPVSPTLPGTGIHPVLRSGATGPAVAELHDKLNTLTGAGLGLSAGMAGADAVVFDAATDHAVRAFQAAHPPMGVDGIVGLATWRRLDALAPGAGAGRIERFGTETARGMQFGGPIEADWALEPDRTAPTRLLVRVRYQFTNDPARPVDLPTQVGRIFSGIRSVWNRFRAQPAPAAPGAPARPPVAIDFQPEEGSPTRHAVTLSAGVGPSNSAHYFLEPGTDVVMLGAHEFGHHIGLQDEYQQTAADHLRQTGEAAPVGQVTGAGDTTAIAIELGRAIRTSPRADRGARALAVVQGSRIDERADEGSLTAQRQCTHPFLYNTDNLMAGAEAQAAGGPHTHDVSPRHVREYVGIVENALGGVWEAAPR
jgi:peptidoglycan hydrolase-like protein with peptidoglycan-binding domain